MNQAGLAARVFREFFRQAWHVIEPSTPLASSWYIDAECDHAQAVTEGKIRNLIVNQPPRTLKSSIWCVAWPAWEWITHPEVRWLYTSYAAKPSIRDSVACRRLIESDWYQRRWGGRFKLTTDQNQKTHFDNDRGGRRICTSVDSGNTSWGGHRIVIDDANQANESDTIRFQTNEWYDQTMTSRQDQPRFGSVVNIQQRVGENDLSGHLMRKPGWDVLCIRMEYEGPQKQTTIGWKDPRSKFGELLCPERIDAEALANIKTMGSYAYASQYQQRPAPAEGGILKKQWWRYWCYPGQPLPPVDVMKKDGELMKVYPLPLPPFDEEAQDWDLTFDDLAKSDFVCGGHWGRRGADKFLMPDTVYERMDFPTTLAAVRKMSADNPRASLKLVEKKANGAALISTLRSEIPGIVPFEPMGGKEQRAAAVSPQVEAGNVYLPHPIIAPWVDAFVEQCASFPNGAHDDYVDMLSMMLLRWQTHSGIFHVSEQSVVCQPIGIPQSWKRSGAMVVRGDKVSAVWGATDPSSGTIYLTMEYVRDKVDPLYHASTLALNRWMPFTISVPDLNKDDERKIAQRYRTLGVKCMDAPGEPEAFLQDMTQAMGTGRFKVFSQLAQWIEQFRLAGNQQDKAITISGDLIRAACLLYGARERMSLPANATGRKPDGLPPRSGPPEGIGINWM